MFRQLFEGGLLLDLPVVSMVAFFIVFVGVIAWVTLRGSDRWQAVARMPLRDEREES